MRDESLDCLQVGCVQYFLNVHNPLSTKIMPPTVQRLCEKMASFSVVVLCVFLFRCKIGMWNQLNITVCIEMYSSVISLFCHYSVFRLTFYSPQTCAT